MIQIQTLSRYVLDILASLLNHNWIITMTSRVVKLMLDLLTTFFLNTWHRFKLGMHTHKINILIMFFQDKVINVAAIMLTKFCKYLTVWLVYKDTQPWCDAGLDCLKMYFLNMFHKWYVIGKACRGVTRFFFYLSLWHSLRTYMCALDSAFVESSK